MIINFSYIQIFSIVILVSLFPFVQNQWLNLSLFEVSNISNYTYLFSLSGLFFPFLVNFYSINKFTFYRFQRLSNNKTIYLNSKYILLIVSFVLITLSVLVSEYIFLAFDYIIKIFLNNNQIYQLTIYQKFIIYILIGLISVINKTKYILKKFILLIFILFSSAIWYSYTTHIIFNQNLYADYKYLNYGNLNYVNIVFLSFIEIIYYAWSFISYKANLSDWMIPVPKVNEISPLIKIILFYMGIFFYYYIL